MVNYLTINRSILWKIIKKNQDEDYIPKPLLLGGIEQSFRDLSLWEMVRILDRYHIDIKREIGNDYIPINICCSNKNVRHQYLEDNCLFQLRLIRSGLKIRLLDLDDLLSMYGDDRMIAHLGRLNIQSVLNNLNIL